MSKAPYKISAFDLDHTLIKTNTSALFYYYLIRKKVFHPLAVFRSVFYSFRHYFFDLSLKDVHEKVFEKFLKGMSLEFLNEHVQGFLKEDFFKLTGEMSPKTDHIPSSGRQIFIPSAASGVAFVDFSDICEQKLAARDYIEVASRYRGLLINKIPILNDYNRNESRRFMWLVDALYEAKCFMICTAEKPIDDIYTGSDWRFEFERTKSRLRELTTTPR